MLFRVYYFNCIKKTAKNCEVYARAICVLSFTSVGQSTIFVYQRVYDNIEIKIHCVYGKTANVSFKLRMSYKIENKQIKTSQNNSFG